MLVFKGVRNTAALIVVVSILFGCGGGGGGDNTGGGQVTGLVVGAEGVSTSVPEDASDYYSFEGVAGQAYTVYVQPTSGDTDVAVLSSSNFDDVNSIIGFSINDGAAMDAVTMTAPATQRFYIEVYGFLASSYRIWLMADGQGNAPVANAGPDQDVWLGRLVTLDGTASFDPQADALTFNWQQVSGMPVTLSNVASSQPSFTAPASPDQLVFSLVVSDGQDQSPPDTVTVTIADPPVQISAQPPATVSAGSPADFQITATNTNNDPISFELAYGPGGMTVDSQGWVRWTPQSALFDNSLDVNWEVGVVSGGQTVPLSGSIRVKDPAQQRPLVRSGIVVPYAANGLHTFDFDNDGNTEILGHDGKLLYTLEYNGTDYVQDWVHPFDISANAEITSLAIHDLSGDGRPEILVGVADSLSYGNTEAGKLVLFDGATRQVTAEIPVTAHSIPSIEVSDVDNDGDLEIVFLANTGRSLGAPYAPGVIYSYDATGLTLEWQSTEAGYGNSLSVGNLDNDVYPEIATAGGYVFAYNGSAYLNDWLYGPGFGFLVDIGDTDNDGIGEIIGVVDWTVVQAYDLVTRAIIWSVPADDLQALKVGDIDNDSIDEVLVGDGQWGNVTAYSYNTVTSSVDTDWQINSQNHGVSSITFGDVDSDPGLEFIWASGATSSGANSLVVAGLNPSIAVEWINDNPEQLDSVFNGAQWLSVAPGDERATFLVPETDSGYNGARLVTMDTWGDLQISLEIDSNWNNTAAFSAADYDLDGTDEIFLATSMLYTGYFAVYDFLADMTEWTSPMDLGLGVAIAQGDLNNDGSPDFAVITREGYVHAYDILNQTQIWDSGYLGGAGVDIAIVEMDGAGQPEIVIALDNAVNVMQSTINGYGIRDSVSVDDVFDMDVGDVNGDGQPEVVVAIRDFLSDPATVAVYDSSLALQSQFVTNAYAITLSIEQSAHARKNLILGVTDDYINITESNYLSWIDADNGNEVFRSPAIVGKPQKNSLNFADTDTDGKSELIFGTGKAMYMTQ